MIVGEIPSITVGDVNWLKETWARQWHREPGEQELRGLFADYLKEVMLAREALDLGLDENDTVVRRRLAQKMAFLLQDTARLSEPDIDELTRYYLANRTRYEEPAQVAFAQIFFKDEAAARRAIRTVAGNDTAMVGDRILLERDFALTDEQTLTNLFGLDFANSLLKLKPGPWQGPIPSAYGFHLVLIKARRAGRLRPLNEVRTQVLDDWYQSRQHKFEAQYLAELSRKYRLAFDEGVKPLIGPLPGIGE